MVQRELLDLQIQVIQVALQDLLVLQDQQVLLDLLNHQLQAELQDQQDLQDQQEHQVQAVVLELQVQAVVQVLLV
jgi:hypothetical protein